MPAGQKSPTHLQDPKYLSYRAYAGSLLPGNPEHRNAMWGNSRRQPFTFMAKVLVGPQIPNSHRTLNLQAFPRYRYLGIRCPAVEERDRVGTVVERPHPGFLVCVLPQTNCSLTKFVLIDRDNIAVHENV